MKKIGLLFVTIIMMMLFAVSASALTEGYYTYEVYDDEATITDVDTSISGDITIPSRLGGYRVTSIGYSAFEVCDNLTSITIPDSVISIIDSAFFRCGNLTSIKIGDSVTSISSTAFEYCYNLTSITVDAANEYYSSDSKGILFDKNKTELIQYPAGNTNSSYVIPDSVISIGSSAFHNCESLINITIPDSVTSIGTSAFGDCTSLRSITIGDNVTSIGRAAFNWCTNLTNITIPNSVTSIDDYAFLRCDSLISITVDTNNKYYSSDGNGVLFDKNKTKLIQYPVGNTRTTYAIPDSVTSIDDYAFLGCYSLTNITIPNSVTSIGYYAFEGCENLTDVYYMGSQSQWNEMAIEEGNDCLTNATIHYNYNPHTHSYTAQTTKAPTHLAEGVMTFTCECGDTYTRDIPKLTEHTYNSVVTDPTCTAQGYTTYTCECGNTYDADYVDANGHSHTSQTTTPATHLTEGVKTYTCACGDSYTKPIAKILEHTFMPSKKTEPTCEKAGYTTYICECGESYDGDYVPEKGHNYSGQMCTSCGKKCSCNCHKTGIANFFWKIANFFNKLFKIKNKQMCACGVSHY